MGYSGALQRSLCSAQQHLHPHLAPQNTREEPGFTLLAKRVPLSSCTEEHGAPAARGLGEMAAQGSPAAGRGQGGRAPRLHPQAWASLCCHRRGRRRQVWPGLSKCTTESQTWSGPTWVPLPSPFQFPVCLGGLPGLWGPCSAISPASSLPTPPKLWTKTKFLFTLKAQEASRCEFKEE